MPRLAIVIPAVGTVEALEATLVSVLENRPRDCEIIVAANFEYADPYDLSGEVQLLAAPPAADFVSCANLGIDACRSQLVHVLAAGCAVAEGWADAALRHFDNPRIAAVAPVVLRIDRRDQVQAAGIEYGTGGARRSRRIKLRKLTAAGASPVHGACGYAGFFRRSALEAVGGCTSDVGVALADVELAWALQRAGYQAVCEPESHVFASTTPLPRESALRHGFHAERMFWRNAGSVGWLSSLCRHPWTVLADTLAAAPRPGMFGRLAGRLWACCQLSHYVRHYHQLNHGLEPADTVQLAAGAERLRIENGHGIAKPSERAAARSRTA